jgi:hypothetical protein
MKYVIARNQRRRWVMVTPTLSERMVTYSDSAVSFARVNFQATLDYSLQSVSSLEEILSKQHAAIPKGWRQLFQKRPSQQVLGDLARMWGSYLGEVVRRAWDGEWVIPEDGPFQGAPSVIVRGHTVCPSARVYKRLTEGENNSVWSYLKALEHMLNAPGSSA